MISETRRACGERSCGAGWGVVWIPPNGTILHLSTTASDRGGALGNFRRPLLDVGPRVVFLGSIHHAVRAVRPADFCDSEFPRPADFRVGHPPLGAAAVRLGVAGAIFRLVVAAIPPRLFPLPTPRDHSHDFRLHPLRVATAGLHAGVALPASHDVRHPRGGDSFRGGIRYQANQIQSRRAIPDSCCGGDDSDRPCGAKRNRPAIISQAPDERLELLGLRGADHHRVFSRPLARPPAMAARDPNAPRAGFHRRRLHHRLQPVSRADSFPRPDGSLGVELGRGGVRSSRHHRPQLRPGNTRENSPGGLAVDFCRLCRVHLRVRAYHAG